MLISPEDHGGIYEDYCLLISVTV